MGCWNETCMVSNMPITAGEDVVSLFIVENAFYDKSRCYSTAFWAPIPWLIYGKYNDYGAVEDFYGKNDDRVVEWIRNRLFEMELGKNEYHDIEVKKDKLTVDFLYEADHAGRLFIKGYGGNYKAKRQVRHVQIKKSLFDTILADFKIEFFQRKDGRKGREDPWVYEDFERHKWSFEEAVADLPRIIEKYRGLKSKTDVLKGMDLDGLDEANRDRLAEMMIGMRGGRIGSWDEIAYDFTAGIMPSSESSSDRGYESIEWTKIFYATPEDEQLELCTEWLRFTWLSAFISHSRKWWTPVAHAGSQDDDYEPHLFMSKFIVDEVQRVKDKRREMWGDDEDDEES